ncbi:MAG: GtrA family protein [Pseudomonadota bacterium]|nr:GtrA family protein [Pseudomonadota bacterium]
MRQRTQALLFLVIGGVQFALDAGLFVALTWFGMVPAWANIAARLSAACLGFFLNGRLTFGHRSLGRAQFARYISTWVLLTAASTITVAGVAAMAGLKWAWLAKLLVEIVLAVASFLLMRNWVFGAPRG